MATTRVRRDDVRGRRLVVVAVWVKVRRCMNIGSTVAGGGDVFVTRFCRRSSTWSKATWSHESAVAVVLLLQKGTEKKNFNTYIQLRQMHTNLTDAKIVTHTVGQIIGLHLLRFDTILIYYIQTKSIPAMV